MGHSETHISVSRKEEDEEERSKVGWLVSMNERIMISCLCTRPFPTTKFLEDHDIMICPVICCFPRGSRYRTPRVEGHDNMPREVHDSMPLYVAFATTYRILSR